MPYELEEIEAVASPILATCLYLRGAITLERAAALARLSEPAFQAALDTARVADTGLPIVVTAPSVSLPTGFLLSVLMPVYNERDTILEILARVLAVDLPTEILVVDDGSTDGTRAILEDEVGGRFEDVRVFYHERNRGKGAAIRTALAHASGSVCLIQDADLEYDPCEYARLLEPILDGRADAVYGSRFSGGGAHRVHLFWHCLGNRLLTALSNMCTNLNLTDMEACYKAVQTDLLRTLSLRCNRFDFEPELTARLARAGARIYEVPISYSGRDYSEGKKVTWRDGLHAIACILRCRLR